MDQNKTAKNQMCDCFNRYNGVCTSCGDGFKSLRKRCNTCGSVFGLPSTRCLECHHETLQRNTSAADEMITHARGVNGPERTKTLRSIMTVPAEIVRLIVGYATDTIEDISFDHGFVQNMLTTPVEEGDTYIPGCSLYLTKGKVYVTE